LEQSKGQQRNVLFSPKLNQEVQVRGAEFICILYGFVFSALWAKLGFV